MTAGFCWEWSDPDSNGNLLNDIVIGDYKRPWDAKNDVGKLAPGIPRAALWAHDPNGIALKLLSNILFNAVLIISQKKARITRKSLNMQVKRPKRPNNSMDSPEDKDLQKMVKMDRKQIESLLKSAMEEYLTVQSNVKSEKAKSLSSLAALISEYLSAFIIIGYNVNREPISLVHATNQMDADALSAAINKFILNSINPEGK